MHDIVVWEVLQSTQEKNSVYMYSTYDKIFTGIFGLPGATPLAGVSHDGM